MDIVYNAILNIVLVTFPILIYFVYSCYESLKYKKYNNIVFMGLLFLSLYLGLKFGEYNLNSKLLLFTNIPIVIAYLKKEDKLAIFLSLVTISYCYFIYHISVITIILKYLSYLIIYYLAKKRKVKNNNFLLLIAILQAFFISFEYFFTSNSNISIIFELFILVLIYYFITFGILVLFNLIEKITSMYVSVEQLEREKQIKTSLFTLTHEVKNPIAVCKGYLDMLNLDNKETAIKYINIIKEEINRSLNIMTDFMEFNKIKIQPEPLDAIMLLEDVYDGFKLLSNSKNIKLNFEYTDEEIYLNGDYNRLKQVLVNMIKNSIEAIDKDGIINIDYKVIKNNLYIYITDNGIGMSKESLSHLTEMFYTTKDKGSGLGVALSNEIIKAHNGTLKYESSLGKGTKAIIKLPILKD